MKEDNELQCRLPLAGRMHKKIPVTALFVEIFVRGIHRWPVGSNPKGPVMRHKHRNWFILLTINCNRHKILSKNYFFYKMITKELEQCLILYNTKRATMLRDFLSAICNDVIWQNTFSNSVFGMTIAVFRFKFHWKLLPRVQLITNQHWL